MNCPQLFFVSSTVIQLYEYIVFRARATRETLRILLGCIVDKAGNEWSGKHTRIPGISLYIRDDK